MTTTHDLANAVTEEDLFPAPTYTPADDRAFAAYVGEHQRVRHINGAYELLELSDAGMQRIFDYDLGAVLRVVAGKDVAKQRGALAALVTHIEAGRVDGTVYYIDGRGCLIGICAVGSGFAHAPADGVGAATHVHWTTLAEEIGVAAHGEPMPLVTESALVDLSVPIFATPEQVAQYSPWVAKARTRFFANLRMAAFKRLSKLGGGAA